MDGKQISLENFTICLLFRGYFPILYLSLGFRCFFPLFEKETVCLPMWNLHTLQTCLNNGSVTEFQGCLKWELRGPSLPLSIPFLPPMR